MQQPIYRAAHRPKPFTLEDCVTGAKRTLECQGEAGKKGAEITFTIVPERNFREIGFVEGLVRRVAPRLLPPLVKCTISHRNLEENRTYNPPGYLGTYEEVVGKANKRLEAGI